VRGAYFHVYYMGAAILAYRANILALSSVSLERLYHWPILYYRSNYRSKTKKPSKNTNYNLGKFYAAPREY
jgi:hypothetical protein